jgi:hypothetical protein
MSGPLPKPGPDTLSVGAAAGCDLLILLLTISKMQKKQDQKIAACGSSYKVRA